MEKILTELGKWQPTLTDVGKEILYLAVSFSLSGTWTQHDLWADSPRPFPFLSLLLRIVKISYRLSASLVSLSVSW